MSKPHMDFIEREATTLLNTLEIHMADSKWQFCNCESCQRRRKLIDDTSGTKIDYTTYRKKDEKY